MKKIYNILLRGPDGKNHFGDGEVGGRVNIKINIKDVGCDVILMRSFLRGTVYVRVLVNTVMKCRFTIGEKWRIFSLAVYTLKFVVHSGKHALKLLLREI